MAARTPCAVRVLAGTIASQPLVFAHLLDHGGGALNLDEVEVICGSDPAARLRHVFDEDTARRIEDAQGTDGTLVLVFDGAGAWPGPSHLLRELGRFEGTRLLAGDR